MSRFNSTVILFLGFFVIAQGILYKGQHVNYSEVQDRNLTCLIEHGEDTWYYLYANSSWKDSFQRETFTGRDFSDKAKWIIEPTSEDGFFKLKNLQYGEYLGFHVPRPKNAECWDLITTGEYTECDYYFTWHLEEAREEGFVYLVHNATKAYVGSYDEATVLCKDNTIWMLFCFIISCDDSV